MNGALYKDIICQYRNQGIDSIRDFLNDVSKIRPQKDGSRRDSSAQEEEDLSVYTHLMNVLASTGRRREAAEVAETMERTAAEQNLPHLWWAAFGLKWLIHFGYGVRRLVFVSFILWLLPALFYAYAYDSGYVMLSDSVVYTSARAVSIHEGGCLFCEVVEALSPYPSPVNPVGLVPPEYTGFMAPIYSLDILIPVLDFGQERGWAPKTEGWGYAIWGLIVVQTLFGWVASALGLAYMAGIMRRDP